MLLCDRSMEVSTVFFDISKAFDSVPHLPLLRKLFVIKVNPYSRKWVHSSLSGREQYVVVNGAKSSVLPVVSGIPQGLVLGSLLFLIYINDATCVVSNGKMVVYADDIALYQIIIHSPKDYFLVQYDIDAVLEWTTANYLAFNYRKCCHLLFSRK